MNYESYKDELCAIYSDAFKDLNGFRPRGVLFERFAALDEEAMEAELLELSGRIEEEVRRERKAKEARERLIEEAKNHPRGFVWDAADEYMQQYGAHDVQAYIAPAVPANDAMKLALASALADKSACTQKIANALTARASSLADLI